MLRIPTSAVNTITAGAAALAAPSPHRRLSTSTAGSPATSATSSTPISTSTSSVSTSSSSSSGACAQPIPIPLGGAPSGPGPLSSMASRASRSSSFSKGMSLDLHTRSSRHPHHPTPSPTTSSPAQRWAIPLSPSTMPMSISPNPSSAFSSWFPASPNPSASSSASSPTTTPSVLSAFPTTFSHTSSTSPCISIPSQSSSRAACNHGTSCPREQQIEKDFCKDFTCCGLVLNDLHELMRHCEEVHVDATFFGEPMMQDGCSPPAASVLMRSLSTATGRFTAVRSSSLSMMDAIESGDEDEATLNGMDSVSEDAVGVDDLEAVAAQEEAAEAAKAAAAAAAAVVEAEAMDRASGDISGFSFEMDAAEEGEYSAAEGFCMDDASSAAMLALFPHLRSSPGPLDPSLDPLLSTASTEDITRPAAIPRIGSTERFSTPPLPPLTISLSDIYCEATSNITSSDIPPLQLNTSNPSSPYSSTAWSDDSDPESDEEIDIISVSSPTREDVRVQNKQESSHYQRRGRQAADPARRVNYLKQYGGLPNNIASSPSPSPASGRGATKSLARHRTNTLLSRAITNKYPNASSIPPAAQDRVNRRAAERLVKATKRMRIASEVSDDGAVSDTRIGSMPSPPFSLDSDEDSMASALSSAASSRASSEGPVAVSSNPSTSAADTKATRRITATPSAQTSKPVPPRTVGFQMPALPSSVTSSPATPALSTPVPPSTPTTTPTDRKPRSRPLPVPKPSHSLQHLTPAQLANARAKAELLVARAVAGELAFNKEKLLQQLQNQQMIQAKEAQKAADKMAAMGGGVTEDMKNDMMANAIVIPATQGFAGDAMEAALKMMRERVGDGKMPGGFATPVFFAPGSPNPGFGVPPTLQPPAMMGMPPGFSEADAASFALAMSAAQGMASPFPTNGGGGGMTTTMMMIDDDDVEPDNTKPRYRLGSMRVADPETGDKKYVCPGCNKEYKNANGLKYHLNHVHPNGDGMPLGFLFGRKKREMEHAFKPFPCVVEGCGKRYKNLNGLKYHIIHSHTAILPNTGDILRKLEGGEEVMTEG